MILYQQVEELTVTTSCSRRRICLGTILSLPFSFTPYPGETTSSTRGYGHFIRETVCQIVEASVSDDCSISVLIFLQSVRDSFSGTRDIQSVLKDIGITAWLEMRAITNPTNN